MHSKLSVPAVKWLICFHICGGLYLFLIYNSGRRVEHTHTHLHTWGFVLHYSSPDTPIKFAHFIYLLDTVRHIPTLALWQLKFINSGFSIFLPQEKMWQEILGTTNTSTFNTFIGWHVLKFVSYIKVCPGLKVHRH